jgi:hypothetical protein
VKQPVAVPGPHPYAEALSSVWRDLELALARLDELAASPAELLYLERALQVGPLQYRLHAASEAVLSLAPPAEALEAHRDLAEALVAAREATAGVLAALEDGEPLAGPVYEWRGALFRVRLARLALEGEEPPGPRVLPWRQIQGVLLVSAAVGAIAVGAHASAWIVVAAGALGAVLGVLLLLRP